MTSGTNNPADCPAVPPRQHNLQEASARALSAIREQSAEQLEWLGARRAGDRWKIAVLDDVLAVELDGGTMQTEAGQPVGPWWQILTLHYLAVSARPQVQEPSITFATLPGGRTYAPVYQQRVIERLCRTVGRQEQKLSQAAEALGGRTVPGGQAAWEFGLYPRVRLRLVWYAGDEELAPSASLLLPANIESFFGLEDIVVLSERLISRLSGKLF